MRILEKIRNKKGIIKAVIYARYSSDNQRDESIDAQIRAIRDYAQRNNIIIVDEYIDRARSAMTDNRPEFLQMVADSAKKEFDVVIVHKLDRFARSRQDSIGYRMQLKRNEVSLISVLEQIDGESPESLILESVLEAMAEYYSLNLAREVRKGMHENALKGKHTGGIAPLGYDVHPDTKMLVINEAEAKIVKLIFQRTIEHVGYTRIIKELNSLGYRTKTGNKFAKNSLYSILTNEKYTGVYTFNRTIEKNIDGKRSNKSKDDSEIIRIKGIVPVIISREDFEKAADIKSSHRYANTGKTSSKEIYLLSGKIICGICGNTYVGIRNPSGRNKVMLVRYGCNRRHRATIEACSNKEIRREYIETFVLEKLSELIFDDALIPAVTEQYNKRVAELNKTGNAELNELNKKLKSLNQKIDNIVNLMAESGSNTLLGKLNELEEEQAMIQGSINKITKKSHEYITEDYISDLFRKGRELLLDKSLPSLKKLIQIFLNKIVIYPDRICIQFNFCDNKNPLHYPMPESPDNEADPLNSFNLESLNFHTVKVGGGGVSPELFTNVSR